MPTVETWAGIVLIAVTLTACGYALFWAGLQYALRNYMPIPADSRVVPEHFVEHEPITGPLELDILETITTTATIEVVPSGETMHHLVAELDALATQLAAETARADTAERLREQHWASLRVARARLNFILGPVLDAPRRPSKQKLAAEIIEIGSARVHVVPPAILNEWKQVAA